MDQNYFTSKSQEKVIASEFDFYCINRIKFLSEELDIHKKCVKSLKDKKLNFLMQEIKLFTSLFSFENKIMNMNTTKFDFMVFCIEKIKSLTSMIDYYGTTVISGNEMISGAIFSETDKFKMTEKEREIYVDVLINWK